MTPTTYKELKTRMKTTSLEGWKLQLPTGATRSKDAEDARYDLVSEIGLERLAQTCKEGCKHGEHNWRKGIPFSNLLNHVMRHINKFKQGDSSEDHLAHAAWGLFALMEFQSTRQELNDLYAYQPREDKVVAPIDSQDKAHIAHI